MPVFPYTISTNTWLTQKRRPGQISNAGFGQLSWIIGSVLDKAAGIETLQVRYNSLAPSLTDTIEGRTTTTITTLDSVLPYVETNKLRLIATMGHERFPTIPDVPAIEEGYAGIAMEGWFVLLGPAGLPAEIVERTNSITNTYLRKPDVQKRLLALGSVVHGDRRLGRRRLHACGLLVGARSLPAWALSRNKVGFSQQRCVSGATGRNRQFKSRRAHYIR